MSNETIPSQELRAALIVYHASKNDPDPAIFKSIAKALQNLATSVVKFTGSTLFDPSIVEEITQRVTFACIEKIDKFDITKKTPAFNYFVTVAINTMRAEYRRIKKLEDLKVKYKKVLKW